MPLRTPADILRTQNSVLAVNVVTLEHAQAFIKASEETSVGIILQISENAVKYHSGLSGIGKAMLDLAEGATTKVSVHLDHATERSLVTEAMELGFNSVMFDGSKLEIGENIEQTAHVVQQAKLLGVWVEAEIGEIGGKDGVHAPGVKTSVADAKSFYESCLVDGLAIAVGSSHAMQEKTATLDTQRIEEIAEVLPIPLVLHGSSGVSNEQLLKAVKAGIKKVNISTELNRVFTTSIRKNLNNDQNMVDPRKYLGPARDEIANAVSEYLRLIR